MAPTLMKQTQQRSGWKWTLARGMAMRVPATSRLRYLGVVEGRVWLTRSGSDDEAAPDVWLAAGDHAALPAGVDVVVEGWPDARFELLEAPPGRGGVRVPGSRPVGRA